MVVVLMVSLQRGASRCMRRLEVSSSSVLNMSKHQYFRGVDPYQHSVSDDKDVSTDENVSEKWNQWDYGSFPVRKKSNKHAIPKVSQRAQPVEKVIYTDKEKADFKKASNFDPLWTYMSDDDVVKAAELLRPLVSAERQLKFNNVLASRTQQVRFVFENPSNANNIWAALRTLDSFGVQFVDIVFNDAAYISEWRKGTMGAALGSQKWMTLKQHDNTQLCFSQLKAEGYTVVASDLHAESLSSDRIDWKNLTAKVHGIDGDQTTPSLLEKGKIAIVMGNEGDGISSSARESADYLMHIPMRGFAESLNLSVAVAVLCAQLDGQGMLSGTLAESTRNRILLTWYARTVRGSKEILRREKFSLPFTTVYDSINNVSTR